MELPRFLSIEPIGAQFTNYAFLASDVTVTATPLRITLPLFAAGLGALGLLGCRKKRKEALAAA